MNLPSGWHKRTLAEVFPEVTVGFVGNVSNHYCDQATGVPFYRTGNVRDGFFSHHDLRFVTNEFHQRNKKSKISNGDILIARVGANLGMVCKADGIDQEANAANVIIIKRNPEANSDFFAEFLRSRLGQSQISAGSVGGAQGVFNTGSAERIVVFVPPRAEQDLIARTLITWNESIHKTEQLIAAKERHYSHELSRLISRGQHLHCHIGAFAEEVSARNRGGNEARVLSVTNSRGFVLPEDQFERRVASADLSNYKVVHRGQYAYNPSRINVGSIARLDGWDDGVLSPMYVVFRLNGDEVNSDYFLHWLNSHEARQRIKNSAQGSVRETVSFSEFAAITIPLPDSSTQTAIARYLNALREEIVLLGQSVSALKTQKRGLMQKLLTGQWRLPVQEEAN